MMKIFIALLIYCLQNSLGFAASFAFEPGSWKEDRKMYALERKCIALEAHAFMQTQGPRWKNYQPVGADKHGYVKDHDLRDNLFTYIVDLQNPEGHTIRIFFLAILKNVTVVNLITQEKEDGVSCHMQKKLPHYYNVAKVVEQNDFNHIHIMLNGENTP